MKFEVLNRFTGKVQFTADIDCDESAARSVKLGLSVKWAIKNSANLSSADLSYADLSSADLSYANLRYANLRYANLISANLISANLRYANLQWALGTVHENLKFIQLDVYHIVYTSEIICIGCEKHSINEWLEFDDQRIIEMDGKKALKFWRKYKDFIFKAIELAPAKPTGFIEKECAA